MIRCLLSGRVDEDSLNVKASLSIDSRPVACLWDIQRHCRASDHRDAIAREIPRSTSLMGRDASRAKSRFPLTAACQRTQSMGLAHHVLITNTLTATNNSDYEIVAGNFVALTFVLVSLVPHVADEPNTANPINLRNWRTVMLISLIIVCHFTVGGCAANACNGYRAVCIVFSSSPGRTETKPSSNAGRRDCGAIAEAVCSQLGAKVLPEPSAGPTGCLGQINAARSALIEFWRESP